MGVGLEPETATSLVAMLDRLLAEPQNLTAIHDRDEAIARHLADSLAYFCLPSHAGALCDVGSGGGLPGLVVARMLPGEHVTLVESEGRKAQWLAREAARLGNVTVVHDRSESLAARDRERFGTVTARALAPPAATLELTAPLVRVGGRVVVWTSTDSAGAWDDADPVLERLGFGVRQAVPVDPFPDSRRMLMLIPKVAPTPMTFPRRPGRATKRALA